MDELADLDARLIRPPGHANELWAGTGWHRLLAELNARLRVLDPAYEVHQVKEKFGGLRFYASTALSGAERAAFDQLIGQAESASWSICEDCGEPGELRVRHGSVYGVRCASCAGDDWRVADLVPPSAGRLG